MPKRRDSKKKIVGVPGRGKRWFGVNRQNSSSNGRKGTGTPPGKKQTKA
ncbi:MAG: hypothetical protein P8Y60_14280 [Calditrichota bacterium]